MPSESGESRTRASKANNPPPEQQLLPCPRCDSTNTKFCYYNNYNFSQPRHFCKSCRRYWTHGGTLRDIPVGGGSRKNAKRSRTHHHHPTTTSTSSQDLHRNPLPATPVPGISGSFSSLLNTQRPGFLALTGFGLGLGAAGIEDMGFGFGRGVWPFPGVGDGCLAAANGGAASGGNVMGNTWQFESGEGGFVGGDCFSWPDLAISTPGNGLK